MSLLNRLQIKTRIILLVILPLSLLLFLAAERYQKADEQLQNLQALSVTMEYVELVSPLIASLQQEWLMTKRYLGPGTPDNPNGLEFKDALQTQRLAVDQAWRKYTAFLQNKQVDLAQFEQLNQNISAIKISLDFYPKVRELIDQRLKSSKTLLNPAGQMVWTLMEIEKLINQLLSSTNQVVLLSAQNQQLGLMANAFQNLIKAKNTAAFQAGTIETGITGTVFPYLYGLIIKYEAMEKELVQSFLGFAPAKIKADYQHIIRETDEFIAANKLYENQRRTVKTSLGKPIDMALDDWLTISESIASGYNQLLSNLVQSLKNQKDAQIEQAKMDVNYTLVLVILLIVIVSFVSLIIIASITKPLNQMVNTFKQLAISKDMDVRLPESGNDEFAAASTAFNSLMSSFATALAGVRAQALAMKNATQSVETAMQTSLQLSENQTSATDTVSVAINQMSATIEEVSSMAQATSDTVVRAHDTSVASETQAQRVQQDMQSLIQELGSTSSIVSQLNEEANQISSVLNVIQAISEQTNLLALNAAIEAARAGELGRGFAVVADEVRSLAQRTQDSTKEIREQIETLLAGAASATNNMQALQNNGEHAISVVLESSKAFSTLRGELDQITEMASQIAVAAEEQTSVSNEINEQIHGIRDDADNMSQQAKQTLEQTNTLGQEGHVLQQHIETFKLN